jgi:hypothetical protein
MAFRRMDPEHREEMMAALEAAYYEKVVESMSDQSSIFGDSGPKLPSAKLKDDGDIVQGVVTRVGTVQQKEFIKGKPGAGQKLFWVPGEDRPRPVTQADAPMLSTGLIKPVMQLVIDVNEQQTVWAANRLLKKIVSTVKAAGGSEVEVGAKIGIRVSRVNSETEYDVKYVRPEGA